jgi:tetratricopeptide (TPR) repeat protein
VSRNPYTSTKRLKQGRAAANSILSTASLSIPRKLATGLEHHRAGRLGEAERLYREILRLDGGNADALHSLGMVALQTGHNDAAAELIRKAITWNGAEPIYHTSLGNVLQRQNKFEEAVGCYDRAIELNPESAAAYSNRGVALHFLGRLEEAGASLERAVELRPESAEAHSNLGSLRQKQGRLEEAEACQRRAVAIQPQYAEAWSNLGSVLDVLGRAPEAVAVFDQALALKPDFTVARVGRSMQRMLMGDFASGLPEYEQRARLGAPHRFSQPQWYGQPLDGARILLHAEQGLGDTIQFLRYLPMVRAAGGEVILEVQPQLCRMAEQLPGIVAVAPAGGALPAFAWHCPLMSLPLAFGTALDSIPARVPYLFVPEEAKKKAGGLPWPATGLRVGLVWAGSPTHFKDRFRSIPLALLEPLLRLQGAHFFSLQVGAAAAQLATTGSVLTDLGPEIEDMADTAALIAQLDLVIAADTSVAHLAGALGKPVWVLLPFAPDWRWLLNREDSPWYAVMRLFRQSTLGDWTSVVEAVRGVLVETIERKRRQAGQEGGQD